MLIPIGDEYPAEMIETVEVEEVAEGTLEDPGHNNVGDPTARMEAKIH